RPLDAPNDLTLDPQGGFYFTDPGSSSSQNPNGSVYYVTPGGHVSLFAGGLAYPNGIVLTENRRRLLVGESSRNRILAWDIAEPGCLFRLDVGIPGLRILAKNRPRPPKPEKKKGKKEKDEEKGGD